MQNSHKIDNQQLSLFAFYAVSSKIEVCIESAWLRKLTLFFRGKESSKWVRRLWIVFEDTATLIVLIMLQSLVLVRIKVITMYGMCQTITQYLKIIHSRLGSEAKHA